MMDTKTDKIAVLVVDDEYLIRLTTADALQDSGFQVYEAANADEAFKVLSDHQDISVLFTDINMPGSFDGLELARRVHQTYPRIQTILTSGRIRIKPSDTPPGGTFIEKPYSAHEVAQLIRTLKE